MLKTFYHCLTLPSFDSRDVKIFYKGRLELCSQLNHRKDFLYGQIIGLNIILYCEACSHKFPVGVFDFFMYDSPKYTWCNLNPEFVRTFFFSRFQLFIWVFVLLLSRALPDMYVVKGSGCLRDSYQPDIFIPFSSVNHLLSTST